MLDEITDEMIDAGASVIAGADEAFAGYPFVLLRTIAAEVYEAMMRKATVPEPMQAIRVSPDGHIIEG